jgi:hypothetical protein
MGVVPGRSAESLDVMKIRGGDSLDNVELLMALEEELEGPLPGRIAELKPYEVDPFVARCIKGGFSIDVMVFARHGRAVLFASLEAPRFGVGALTSAGEIRQSSHYPTLAMAARSFFGMVKRGT